MLEADLEKILVESIQSIGGLCFKCISSTTRGLPDRIIHYQGVTVYCELKTIVGKLSLYQKYIHNKLRDQGVQVYVIRTPKEVKALCMELLCQNTKKKLFSGQ